MIPSTVGSVGGFNGDQQATNVAKESPKTTTTRSIAHIKTNNVDGNNQNTLSNSGIFASSTHSASVEGEAVVRFPNSAANSITLQKSIASMVSFNSSSDEGPDASRSNEVLGNKVDVVYSLLSMLSSHDRLQSSQMLLSISQDRENCQLIRRSGCMSLLIQLLHPSDVMPLPPPTGDELEVIRRASEALKNIVRFDDDETRQRRDSVVLSLLEHARNYVLHLRLVLAATAAYQNEFCEQAYTAMAGLTKLSYDEEQRRAMCILGGLHCIAEALILDQKIFNDNCPPMNMDFRRFIGMTLTNLTYGASETKRTLCSSQQFLQALNAQIGSQPEELRQVFAGVLRNLSWKTDASSKSALREAGTVATLMRAAMEAQKEATLKSILSALWNLSAHCTENKIKICAVPSALEFLISTLAYKSPSRSMAVVESGGGILRNVSSHISIKEEYRTILRQHNCFQILLEHLQSPSLTIVSNACGTLWNLSAHSVVDQRTLWSMGAEKKLRDLVHSKHKMISLGSSATLKNLLASRPKDNNGGGGGSSNSSTTSISDKKNYGFMKLRQLQTTNEQEGDENQMLFISSLHNSPATRSMTGEPTLSDPSMASPQQRRQTPAIEIAAMLNDVTRPMVMKSATPAFRIPSSTPPSSKNQDRGMSTSQFMNETTTLNADLIRSQQRMHSSTISASFSLPSSKEEQMQIDKAAGHRYHILRRNSQPQTSTAGDERQQQQHNFTTPIYENTTIQNQPPYGYCEQASARFVQSGGMPLRNTQIFTSNPFASGADIKRGSPEKHKSMETRQENSIQHQQQQRMPPNAFRKPSGPTTPAEFKSEPSSRGSKSVTALTPLMFSRASSLESLDSCDQHSVRSTVYSEYSQLPTGLPSPSELPDSPTNTMPSMMAMAKPQMFPHQPSQQQQRGFNSEERRISEPSSIAGASSTAAAAVVIYPCYSEGGSSSKQDIDEEKPKIYGKQPIEVDDEEKPRIFGKSIERGEEEEKPRPYGGKMLQQSPAGEFESNKLSASSSLSALTIDTDTKAKPLGSATNRIEIGQQIGYRNQQQQQHFVFDQPSTTLEFRNDQQQINTIDNLCQELQDCIMAAKPSPKINDNSFKIPRPIAKPTPINRTNTNMSSKLKPPIPTANVEPSNAIGGGGGGGEDESDLQFVMQSAMPKPKTGRSKTNNPNIRIVSPQHRGKNVAIAKPIVRAAPTATNTNTMENIRPYQGNLTVPEIDAPPTTSSTTNNPREENVMEKSEELQQCIALALPKPKTLTRKSKSLDRKSQRKDLTVAFTNSVEIGQERKIEGAANDHVLSGNLISKNHYDDENSKQQLLLLSCSSALMSSATTAERIKDATLLYDTSNNSIAIRSPPVARIAPEPHGGGNNSMVKNDPVPNSGSKSSDSPIVIATNNDDSLSEDNYSQICDDSFNVEPEDVDVDSIKDEDWFMVNANDGCGEFGFFNGAHLPSPTELLIDCETFSSATSTATDDNSGRPKILKGSSTSSAMKMKLIKGGQRTTASATPPKVTVRTTKATELRAKKTLQEIPPPSGLRPPTTGGNSRSRSMSPAMNSGVLKLTMRRTTDVSSINSGKISPSNNNNRFRHYSSSSSGGRQENTTIGGGQQKEENPMKKSPNFNSRQQQSTISNSSKSKRELGSNVKRKIESLQKRESSAASEDDSATSPLMYRKGKNIGNLEQRGSPKSPQPNMGKTNQMAGNHSNKDKDGKRALVTTV